MASSATGEPTGYPPTQAAYESRAVNGTSPTAGRAPDTLPAPASLELTKEDKQEGYDISLLNLPERKTGAAAPPADPSANRTSSSLAADQPYVSRARDSSFDRSDGARESFGWGKEGLTSGTAKKTVRHHSSSARDDHHRSTTKRGGGRKRKGSKKLKWWQKPITLVAILLLVIVVGVAVGLGVGLGVKKNGGSSKSTTTRPQSGPTIEPSTSGAGRTVQVSASQAPSPSVRPAGSGASETVAPGRLARRVRA